MVWHVPCKSLGGLEKSREPGISGETDSQEGGPSKYKIIAVTNTQ